MASFDHRHDSGNYLRRVVALSCAQSRIDGERVDTGGRAFNHNSFALRREFSSAAIYCWYPPEGSVIAVSTRICCCKSESLHWRNLALGHDLADFHFTKHGSAQIRDFLIDLLKRMLRELLRW